MKDKDIINLYNNMNDKYSNILFNKDYNLSQIGEIQKVDEYIKDINNPIWKDIYIDGKITNYEVSNIGEIRNKVKNKFISIHENKKGYQECVIFYFDNGNFNNTKHTFVHRLVAEAFIPNPENKPQVNHINGIKTCNWVGNLEWVTNQENIIHAWNNNLIQRRKGVETGNSKISEEEVHKICKLLEEGLNINDISSKLSINKSIIIGIKYNKNWESIRNNYNIPDSKDYKYKSNEQKKIIEKMISDGIRDRKLILSKAGMTYDKTNISYIKYKINQFNKANKSSSTI